MLEMLLGAVLAGSGSLPAFALALHRFDIPEESAPAAIRAFGAQAHVQIVAAGKSVKGKRLHAVYGDLSTEDALNTLLFGSGLTHRYVGDGSVALLPESQSERAATGGNELAQSGAGGPPSQESFLLAQETQGTSTETTSVEKSEQAPQTEPVSLQEVVITAQKREERLSDVPIPVSVINTQALADNGQVLLQDYYSSVPGLNIVPNFVGVTNVNIRGITTGDFETPTVSFMVDDVPFGGSTNQVGNFVPEVDPGDLDRIEVLRGPQGTLYGADSMGGLIKYVTKDPSTEGYSGRIETGTSSIYNGAQPGFNIRAAANIPLSDTLAIRVSGFRRQDPGYIGNVLTGQTGINEAEADGARLAAMWRPSTNFSLKVSALYQELTQNGVSQIDTYPGLGDLQQERLPNTGGFDRTIQAYSAILNYKFGNADLTSVTSFNTINFKETLDETPTYGLDEPTYGSSTIQQIVGVAGAYAAGVDHGTKFSQELRLNVPIGPRFNWLLGGFFTRENSYEIDAWSGEDPFSGHLNGNLLNVDQKRSYTESAVFSDLTYNITDRIDVQVGGRESFIRSVIPTFAFTGALFGSNPFVTVRSDTKSNAFTYLVTPRFRVTPDVMIYARFASGYRLGGTNPALAVAGGAPANYGADITHNYEVGIKGDFLDHRLSVDASLFYIDWPGLQTQLVTTNAVLGETSYTANVGAAKSEGVELSVAMRPLSGVTINVWADYTDAVLTQGFPANSTASGAAGDRLPYSAKWSGNASVEQQFPLWNAATGFIGSAVSYQGERENDFVSTGQQRYSIPGYTKVDIRAGVKFDSWTVNAYANNVNNSRGILENHVGANLYPFAEVVITPRTVGLSVTKTFSR